MPVNLIFCTFKESKPMHDRDVIVIETSSIYDSLNVSVGTAEYTWEVVDSDGDFTGESYRYEDENPPCKNCKLSLWIDGKQPNENWLWSYYDNVFNVLANKESNPEPINPEDDGA